MTDKSSRPIPDPSDQPSLGGQIDEVRDQFELAWFAGERPQIKNSISERVQMNIKGNRSAGNQVSSDKPGAYFDRTQPRRRRSGRIFISIVVFFGIIFAFLAVVIIMGNLRKSEESQFPNDQRAQGLLKNAREILAMWSHVEMEFIPSFPPRQAIASLEECLELDGVSPETARSAKDELSSVNSDNWWRLCDSLKDSEAELTSILELLPEQELGDSSLEQNFRIHGQAVVVDAGKGDPESMAIDSDLNRTCGDHMANSLNQVDHVVFIKRSQEKIGDYEVTSMIFDGIEIDTSPRDEERKIPSQGSAFRWKAQMVIVSRASGKIVASFSMQADDPEERTVSSHSWRTHGGRGQLNTLIRDRLQLICKPDKQSEN